MPMSQSTTELLDVVGRVLIRSFLLGYMLLVVWFALVLLAPSFLHWMGGLFDITPEQVNLGNYCGMAFAKLCILIFFLFPYIAIRLVVRGSDNTL
jgi:hypothetical protein